MRNLCPTNSTETPDTDHRTQILRGRLHRNKLARRKRRRALAFRSLVDPVHLIQLLGGDLTPQEQYDLLHGHLCRSKALLRKLNRRASLLAVDIPVLPSIPENEKLEVQRPKRRMTNARRGLRICRFSAPKLPVPTERGSIKDNIERLKDPALQSYCRYRVLEFATALLGVSLQGAARVVGTRHLDGKFCKNNLASFERYTAFQKWFEHGRQAYAVVVQQENLQIARGDWAFFEHEELQNLLPGIRIPKRLYQVGYLVKLHTDDVGNPQCLDFYSMRYHPVIRCPLGPKVMAARDESSRCAPKSVAEKIKPHQPNHLHMLN